MKKIKFSPKIQKAYRVALIKLLTDDGFIRRFKDFWIHIDLMVGQEVEKFIKKEADRVLDVDLKGNEPKILGSLLLGAVQGKWWGLFVNPSDGKEYTSKGPFRHL